MCGGISHLSGAPVDAGLLTAMGNITRHRGPDDLGLHVDGPCAIGMTGLSIIDLAGGYTRAGVEHSVRMQMVSDGPIEAFLSGGVDSSAVVAYMARATQRPIGFEGGPAEALYNELYYARRVAGIFGTEHDETVVPPDVVGMLPVPVSSAGRCPATATRRRSV